MHLWSSRFHSPASSVRPAGGGRQGRHTDRLILFRRNCRRKTDDRVAYRGINQKRQRAEISERQTPRHREQTQTNKHAGRSEKKRSGTPVTRVDTPAPYDEPITSCHYLLFSSRDFAAVTADQWASVDAFWQLNQLVICCADNFLLLIIIVIVITFFYLFFFFYYYYHYYYYYYYFSLAAISCWWDLSRY